MKITRVVAGAVGLGVVLSPLAVMDAQAATVRVAKNSAKSNYSVTVYADKNGHGRFDVLKRGDVAEYKKVGRPDSFRIPKHSSAWVNDSYYLNLSSKSKVYNFKSGYQFTGVLIKVHKF